MLLTRLLQFFGPSPLKRFSVPVVTVDRVGPQRPVPAIDDGAGLIMGRKVASPPTDRSVAETRERRGDSRQGRRQVAQPRLRVADVAKIRRRGRHPTKQSHLTAIEVNETCPQVVDDFSHPSVNLTPSKCTLGRSSTRCCKASSDRRKDMARHRMAKAALANERASVNTNRRIEEFRE